MQQHNPAPVKEHTIKQVQQTTCCIVGGGPVGAAAGPPMDILWFRLSQKESDTINGLGGRIKDGHLFVLIKRIDYWQAGIIIPKGGYQELRAQGLEQLRQRWAQAIPELADRARELQTWQQIAVLAVESNRLPRWYRPGLLLIGDAAHVMSPVGGVGINYAISSKYRQNRLADVLPELISLFELPASRSPDAEESCADGTGELLPHW